MCYSVDAKLTVGSRVTPCYYSNNRNIMLDCSTADTTSITFCSNDNSSVNNNYDCIISSRSGLDDTPGKGELAVYNNKTLFYGDVNIDENNLSCKTFKLNGDDLTSIYHTKSVSDDRYYTKSTSDDLL